MTEKLTRIRAPGMKNSNAGICDWGVKSRSEMVSLLRSYADHLREAVAVIDATEDEDFEVEIVLGSAMQKHVRWVE